MWDPTSITPRLGELESSEVTSFRSPPFLLLLLILQRPSNTLLTTYVFAKLSYIVYTKSAPSTFFTPLRNRSLLSIGLHADSRPGTKAAQNRNVVQSIIESSNADMEAGVHIDLAKLEELPIHWDNKPLHLPIPDSICREILNDIFFVSFSSELIMADEFFYEIKGSINKEGEDEMEGTTCKARKIKVLNKISTFVHDNELGFGSANLSLRQSTAYGLYEIMRGWTRTRSMSLQSTAIMSRLAGVRSVRIKWTFDTVIDSILATLRGPY
ncbi:hypothetical protein F5890DRAFT_1559647 [Lentinula detonsa]|uniref:Uncharacterized protein n=1 Tax=Lentinula detonsa TaxID=2804962 RepID=A0AA38PNN8_9AGAR|nr:hypothetical protein F5890DRAFT_1559647 [Lentinula detonsa]